MCVCGDWEAYFDCNFNTNYWTLMMSVSILYCIVPYHMVLVPYCNCISSIWQWKLFNMLKPYTRRIRGSYFSKLLFFQGDSTQKSKTIPPDSAHCNNMHVWYGAFSKFGSFVSRIAYLRRGSLCAL